MKHALMVAGAVLAVVVMAGCSAATGKAEPEPTPEPTPPPPGIQGSWSWSTTYIEDGRTETESLLLTFTAGGRFIESWKQSDVDGNETGFSYRQGEWMADDTTITKAYHEPYHQDGPQSRHGGETILLGRR